MLVHFQKVCEVQISSPEDALVESRFDDHPQITTEDLRQTSTLIRIELNKSTVDSICLVVFPIRV